MTNGRPAKSANVMVPPLAVVSRIWSHARRPASARAGSGDAGGKTDMPTAFQKSWHSTQYRPCALRRSINRRRRLAGRRTARSDRDRRRPAARPTDHRLQSDGEAGADGATLTWTFRCIRRAGARPPPRPIPGSAATDRARHTASIVGTVHPSTGRSAAPVKAGHAERGRPPGDVSAASPRRDARLRNGAVLSAALAAIEVDGGVSAVTAR